MTGDGAGDRSSGHARGGGRVSRCGHDLACCDRHCVDTSTSSDANNCGACGNACGVYGGVCQTPADCCGYDPNLPSRPVGQSTCVDGVCRCCQAGERACNGDDHICCPQPADAYQYCTMPECDDPRAQRTWVCTAPDAVGPNQNPCPASYPYENQRIGPAYTLYYCYTNF